VGHGGHQVDALQPLLVHLRCHATVAHGHIERLGAAFLRSRGVVCKPRPMRTRTSPSPAVKKPIGAVATISRNSSSEILPSPSCAPCARAEEEEEEGGGRGGWLVEGREGGGGTRGGVGGHIPLPRHTSKPLAPSPAQPTRSTTRTRLHRPRPLPPTPPVSIFYRVELVE
jgi:hypothetical protein